MLEKKENRAFRGWTTRRALKTDWNMRWLEMKPPREIHGTNWDKSLRAICKEPENSYTAQQGAVGKAKIMKYIKLRIEMGYYEQNKMNQMRGGKGIFRTIEPKGRRRV